MEIKDAIHDLIMSQESDEIAVTPAAKPSSPGKRKAAPSSEEVEDLDVASTTPSVSSNSRSPPERSAPPPAKKPRLNSHHPAFTRPTISAEDIKSDLKGFGFSKQEIKDMLAKKDTTWDPGMPGYLLGEAKAKAKAKEQGREKRERAKKNNRVNGVRGEEKRYEPLFLVEGSNWALFDPSKPLPAMFGEPPAFFTRYMTFQPGSKRILEYNVLNQSVRLRSTPAVLLTSGTKVEYTKSGPKIVEEAIASTAVTPTPPAPKKTRGRPKKNASPKKSRSPVNGVGVKPGFSKSGKKLGRPRKSEARAVQSEGSDSSLTDLESEGEDGDWDESVDVKGKKEKKREGSEADVELL